MVISEGEGAGVGARVWRGASSFHEHLALQPRHITANWNPGATQRATLQGVPDQLGHECRVTEQHGARVASRGLDLQLEFFVDALYGPGHFPLFVDFV